MIRPLQRGADGTYQVRIEMRPPELGRVDMRVEIRDGVVHASIHAEHAQTADLVRSALHDLRARLDADGMRSGQFTVDSQGAGSSNRDNQSATSRTTRRGNKHDAAGTDPGRRARDHIPTRYSTSGSEEQR